MKLGITLGTEQALALGLIDLDVAEVNYHNALVVAVEADLRRDAIILASNGAEASHAQISAMTETEILRYADAQRIERMVLATAGEPITNVSNNV